MATHHRFRGSGSPPALETVAVQGSRVMLLGLAVAFVAAKALGQMPSLEAQLVVYLVGMIALNLPHGGYEHFSNLRRRGLPFGARYVGAYALCIAAFVALFFVAPIPALGLAFAVAVAKAGHGDLHVMDALVGSDHLETRLQRALAAVARGGAVMIVPLVAWPDTFNGFSTYMLLLFDPGAVGALGPALESARTVLGVGYALAVVGHLTLGYAVGGGASWLRDVAETGLLVGYFAAVPVVVAVGLYFPLWYSLRQAGRERYARRIEPATGLSVKHTCGAMLAGGAATAAVAGAFWVVVPNPLGGLGLLTGLVAFYTIFVCVIALPHVVIGEWLDAGRGIWYVP
ncbi:Brp/Blh family beta-carotene 15,15'-dioxygenase [Natronobacterium haloterrestre]